MDRDTKLLARLRGSHSRNVKRSKSISFADVDADLDENANVDADVEPVFDNEYEATPDILDVPVPDTDTPHAQGSETDNISTPDVPRYTGVDAHIQSSAYDFEDIPVSRLYSSITSVTTIHVLQAIFTNLLQNDLIPQALTAFNGTTNVPRLSQLKKMSHKLDMRIFQVLAEQLTADLDDLLDINKANNELCYQLKELTANSQLLNKELIAVRKEHQTIKYGGKKHKLENDRANINSKIQLNAQLVELTEALLNDNEDDQADAPLTINSLNLRHTCELLDPHNGLVKRLQSKINEIKSLQEDST
ncbi:related to Central kinetochore subunit AME1 [Nakaseomyces glabratus]|nr:hypothetical protein J6894_03608 [Nakaseomyces glabratus]QNG15680.1 uncharacterized protein GWK60_K06479 [Nakaseomyces glabratus]SCV14365.1 related to Central kinetochore subunit AME1 [Nakaseomyces glabratus]SLM13023.1 related to Central kinetochore subunit AME1 [Nakaseomyces glabratus]